MGRIIRLHGDRHQDIQTLLPWYVTGQLEPGEHARVAAHLGVCRECQAELRFERRLDEEIVDLPVDVEQGWALMQRRIEVRPRGRRRSVRSALAAAGRRLGRRWRAGAPWLGWAVAAPAMMVLAAGLFTPAVAPMVTARATPATYHALGAPPQAAAGNILVIFRPDTRERDLRRVLQSSHVRLVDGPTAADAYLLRAPAADRAATVASLRGRPEVVLAEPIDSGGPP